jgi:hypothetical protein
MYAAGFFNPEISDQALIAMEMMDFEGKEMVMKKVRENGTMMQQMLQMQMQIAQMAGIIDQTMGSNLSGAVGGQPVEPQMPPQSGGGKTVDDQGNEVNKRSVASLNKAKQRVEEGTKV